MGFLSGLLKTRQVAPCVIAETHPVYLQILAGLGFDLKKSPDLTLRLVPAINSAVDYFDAEIAKIPGPIDISAAHFGHGSIVQALFPARQEIAHGMGRSMDVRQPLAFLAGAEQKDAYALLGLRRSKPEQDSGDAPVFCDHTLRSVAATESGVRQALRTAALTRLATAFGEYADGLRRKRDSQNPAEQAGDEATSAKTMLTPEHLVDELVGRLQNPAQCLQLLPAANQELAAGLPEPARQIEMLPGLQCSDRRRWPVCIVSFPTAEGLAAIGNESNPHRYISI